MTESTPTTGGDQTPASDVDPTDDTLADASPARGPGLEDDVLRQSVRSRLFESGEPTVVGRFRITGELGRGGMGVVYAGFDPELRRPVAIKILSATDAATSGRLRTEARAMARVNHPNVAAVHDFGEVEGQFYIAMEFAEGRTIGDWLREERPGLWQLLDVFAQAGAGLAAAHAQGLVHGDFKPSNAVVTHDGKVKVLDFGLARRAPFTAGDVRSLATTGGQLDSLAASLVKTGIAGTPAYMAPEQFRGERATEASDQFSFCVSLWEALVGQRPFQGKTMADLIASVMGEAPKLPAEATFPEWLVTLLSRGTSKNVSERFDSMASLLAALERGRFAGGISRMPAPPLRINYGGWIAGVLLGSSLAAYGTGYLLGRFSHSAVDKSANQQQHDRIERTVTNSVSYVEGAGVLLTGLAVLIGFSAFYSRGTTSRQFGDPKPEAWTCSVPAHRVLEVVVRSAPKLDMMVDDQDWDSHRICLRQRPTLLSVGVYFLVEASGQEPTQVRVERKPILPAIFSPFWRRYSRTSLVRLRCLLGDDRSYPISLPDEDAATEGVV